MLLRTYVNNENNLHESSIINFHPETIIISGRIEEKVVHTYSLNNYKFAIDGNSASIHSLDNLSYDILQNESSMPSLDKIQKKLSGRYGPPEISETYAEIQSLFDQGMLFSSEESLSEAAAMNHFNPAVKALCLHVSHDCNLRCEYCFASSGDYNSGRELMDKEIARKAVDYLVANSGNKHNIEIDFFGGEPLMNFDVVKDVVIYGRSIEKAANKHFYFTITTNGSLLTDDRIHFINEHMDNVVISIDGRKEVHDRVRHDSAGHGSYDHIMPMAQKLVAGRNGKSYFVRGTFTKRNMDFSKDVMHLAHMGFDEISVEPVVGSGSDLYFDEADIPALLQEYENLALQYIDSLSSGHKFRFYHFHINLYNGPCLFKRINSCGAGGEYLAVSPKGDLYPCHQFVGQDEFIVGNVNTGIQNQDLCSLFRKTNILTKAKCRDCWAKLFCSGGCHAHAFYSNGSINKPDELSCTLQKKRIECAVMIQTLRSDKGI